MDKVAIITGAAAGQGKRASELFRENDYNVVLIDKKIPTIDIGEDKSTLAMKCDVANQSDWQQVIEKTLKTFGRIDVLVNNAAIFEKNSIQDTSYDQFKRIHEINQHGTFLGMKAVIPTMQKLEKGSIVNIASVGGLKGWPGEFAYCSSKWAVRGMTRCAAADLASFGIRVNVICPGPISTPMTDIFTDEEKKEFSSMVPLGRFGEPREVAEMTFFLASDKASYITGAEIAVDGGMVT